MIKKLLLIIFFLLSANTYAQNTGSVGTVSSLPGTCSVGSLTILTVGTTGLYWCDSTNHWTQITSSVIPLPVTAGGTNLATLTSHALYVGNGASSINPIAVCTTGTYIRGVSSADPICSTLVLPNAATTGDLLASTSSNTVGVVAAVATGQVLVSQGTSTLPAYATYAASMSTPSNQTGNATATFKMNGLACAITPTATGKVVFYITGSIGNNTTADSVTWKLAYGTGSAPSNAAAATGTVLGAIGVFKALTGQLDAPFTSIGYVSGLTLNTAVWFDLQIADITGGTASATAVTCVAQEQ